MNWQEIPKYPDYLFNKETLEIKSLRRKKEVILQQNKNKNGYYYYSLTNKNGCKTMTRSRIIWLVEYGELPPKPLQIDHIDGDKTNDNIKNLQLLTNRQNSAKGWEQNGKKLPTGVSWNKVGGKYTSHITINYKDKHLGVYDTIDEASLAYQNELLKIEEK